MTTRRFFIPHIFPCYPHRVHVCIFAIESETRVQQRQRGEIIEFFLRNPHCVSAIIIEHFVPLHQVRLDCCDNNSSAASFAAARKTSFHSSYVNRADWALLLPHLFSFAMSRSSRHERCRKLWLYEKEMSRDREKSWGLYIQHEMSKWWARKLLLPSCSARTRPESSVPKTIGGEENI